MLVGIYFAATGRGGEMAYEHADHAPLDLGPVSGADIALLRPPTAMWGYNMQVTDEALDRIARAMRERDVTIAYLQEQLATLVRNGSWAAPTGANADQVPYAPQAPESPLGPEIPAFPEASEISAAAVTPESPQDPEAGYFPWEPEYADTPESPQDPEAGYFPWEPEYTDITDPADAVEFAQGSEFAPGITDPADAVEFAQGSEFAPGITDAPQAPEAAEAADAAGTAEVAGFAEAPTAPEPAVTPEAPQPPRTPLVLKASPAKAPPAAERHEVTQPSEIVRDFDPTQPSPTQAPHETQGPQGAFDTHDWWAEQEKAAREEAARRQAADPSTPSEGEQG